MSNLRLKDKNSIAIGPAEVRIGPSATSISTLTPVLDSSRTFMYSEKTSVVYQNTYVDKKSVKYNYAIDSKSDEVMCTIQFDTVELSKNALAIVFGNDPASITTEISLGNISSIDFRVEILYTYPDTTKTLNFVFPKVRIQKGLNIVLTGDAEVSLPLSMKVLPVNTSPWTASPFGKIYPGGF